MKKRVFLFCMLFLFLLEAAVLTLFFHQDPDAVQDVVAVNEVVKTVEADWDNIGAHTNKTSLDYVVLDDDGTVLFRTGEHLCESIFAAVAHRDTILDVTADGRTVGKVIIRNTGGQMYALHRNRAFLVMLILLVVQLSGFIVYFIYLEKVVIRPFQRLRGFAERIAGGNLDIPLTMDRKNLFGAFTESFDIMRAELKKARIAEAEANAGKKELVAKLSHDIKTPVASIKAAAELGCALSENKRMQDNYTQIIRKADQISALVGNLFTATLEELQQLPVQPVDLNSGELKEMLENADYLHRAALPKLPACLLSADRLRLQQVFDNLFANSYKYADTDIVVSVARKNNRFVLAIEDYGGGVAADELVLLKEKFWRGSNAKETEGAGLGLFISDYFMKEMGGELAVENGVHGLKVSVAVALS